MEVSQVALYGVSLIWLGIFFCIVYIQQSYKIKRWPAFYYLLFSF